MKLTLQQLRQHAIANTLFAPVTLHRAVERLGFVQADPIRSPARAQDLILRHRVRDYRAGDLERRYSSLGFEEDFLYAYGFMPQSTWQLLHPRVKTGLNEAETRVLEIVTAHKRLHPRELETYLGKEREINGWGGYSKATTRALHALHYRGLLRIAGRENGIRLYERAAPATHQIGPEERLDSLVLLIANILAPVPVRSLLAALQLFGFAAPALKNPAYGAPAPERRKSTVARLIDSGKLAAATVDSVPYVWPASRRVLRPHPADQVRFFAPFDPLVWDRRRFEHLWGWAYRFEAYTPPAKRKLGYYAMPLLWRDEIAGWVNISKRGGGLDVDPGFVKKKPTGAAFRVEFESEVERFRRFLQSPLED